MKSRRSIAIVRMVLRATLDDAVETGQLRRSPAARVGMPYRVTKPDLYREAAAWTADELRTFLVSSAQHRWAAPIRLAALFGLRRSELLGLRWSVVDLRKASIRIDRALIEVHGRPEWSDGKNARSRRTFPIDPSTVESLRQHGRLPVEDRLVAGPAWHDLDPVVATRTGNIVSPGNFDQTLERLVAAAGTL